MMEKPAKGAKPKEAWTTEFEGWTLETTSNFKEVLDGLIQKGVAEAFAIIAENNARGFFKIEDDSASDPTDIVIDIVSKETWDDDVSWTFSLSDVVARFIDNHMNARDGYIYGEAEKVGKISGALRALADQLDARVPKAPEAS